MNVRVRCTAADSIYANNANRMFRTKYGISTSFVRKGRTSKDEPLRRVLRNKLSKERAARLEGSFGTQKQHYSPLKDKGTEQENGNLIDFLRNPYGKCRTDDRQDLEQNGQGGMTCICGNTQKKFSDFFRSVMSCRRKLGEKRQKNT